MKLRPFILNVLLIGGGFVVSEVRVPSEAQEIESHMNKGGGDRIYGAPWATRSAVIGANAMVATSHPLSSQIAIDILKSGGNAVDAAIAANAALGLMEPTGNGIGGDLFAIIWDPKTEKLHGLNASGRSSLSQTLDQLKTKIGVDRRTILGRGAYAVSVPGAVDGWDMMLKRFGSKDMSELMAPAVRYAREGFPMTQVIGNDMANNLISYGRSHKEGTIEEFDNFRNLYFKNGKAPIEGEIFKNPDLGNTLETIGREGRDAFYKGDIARTMANYMKRIGGPITYEDFAAHTSNWIEPVSVNYRGLDVWELPPNGQGIAALMILNIMEGFDLKDMGRDNPDYWHAFVEASKVVYEDRARFYADPDFYKVSVEKLLSKEYAAERRKLIDMDKAAAEIEHGDPKLLEGDTIYLTIADENGMMISLIQSNYSQMGSGLVPDGLGFAFQNRGSSFSLDEGHPNAYAPNKRPFHTIIPAFVTKDGKPWMSFGLMGGAIQPQGHAQIIVDMVDFGMTVQEAGDAARFFHTGSTEPNSNGRKMDDGGTLLIEKGISLEITQELRRRGHEVRYTTGPFGGYEAIYKDPETGVYWGASEMRKDGMAIGY
ncbi:MAG: gamma-glutamyltransferase [Emcibacteraceae bacterium]|nr:gamma-glutamyltransferase [Emcibacteraceae bacterium]